MKGISRVYAEAVTKRSMRSAVTGIIRQNSDQDSESRIPIRRSRSVENGGRCPFE